MGGDIYHILNMSEHSILTANNARFLRGRRPLPSNTACEGQHGKQPCPKVLEQWGSN